MRAGLIGPADGSDDGGLLASIRKVRKGGQDTGRWQGVAEVPRALWPTHGRQQTRVVDGVGRAGESAARRWADNRETELREELERTGPGELYIGDFYEQAKHRLGHTGRTPAEVATVMRVYVVPRWGATPVQQWDRKEFAAWLARLQSKPLVGDRLPDARGQLRPVSAERCRAVLAHAKGLVSRAVDEGLIDHNPIERVKPPAVPPPRPRFIPEDEFLAAVRLVDDPGYRRLLYALGFTGLRLGEASALTDDVLVDHGRTLLVRHTIIEDDGCRHSLKQVPKGKRDRPVPVPGHVAEVLAEQRAVERDPLTLPVAGDSRGRTRKVDLLFRAAPRPSDIRSPANAKRLARRRAQGVPERPSKAGGPICRHDLDAAWKRAQLAAGIAEPYRIHDLRHLAASLWLTAGLSLAEVGDLLGHASPAATVVYAHLVGGWQDKARQAMERPPGALTLNLADDAQSDGDDAM
jgi:integrase